MNIFERCLGAAAQSTLIYSTLLFVWTPPLQAQDSDSNKADEAIEEIVVIGSHIKRRDFVSPSPISTMDREALAFSTQPTLEESLNRMPQVMPDFDRTANNPGDGTARVNLRGLGSGRTLVLLNGRRVAPSGVSSSVDVNNIPQALVERVEVITGGATTVYGSDAVAGVVNFVTRDDFEGFGLDTGFYTTQEGDSNIFDLNLSYGHNFENGRGNITLFGGYYDREATVAGERQAAWPRLADWDGELILDGSNRVPESAILFPQADLGSGPVQVTFDPDGNPVAYRDPEDRYLTDQTSYLQTPLRRYSGGLFLNYDIAEDREFYVELSHTRNDAVRRLGPIGVGGFFDTNIDNPVLTPEAQQIFADNYIPVGANTVSYFVGRRLVESGNRIQDSSRDYSRLATGVRGELNSNWDFDVWVTYTSSEEETLLLNDASDARLRQGLLVDPATGQCFDPSNGCVPVDIFGAGRISAEALAFIAYGPLVNKSSRDQELASAFVSGTPFDSWAGAVQTAIGVEWRSDTANFKADDALFTGDTLGYRGDASVNGKESVFEVYGEALIPLAEDLPFAEYLAIELGARYSSYDNAGSVDTFKIGGEWTPIDGVRFRTMFQRSVRAPSISEAFLERFTEVSPFVGNDSNEDPCSASADPVGNGLTDKCIITGVPADQIGIFEANIAYPTDVIRGGNPNLEPESSDTVTIGVVFTPPSMPNWNASFDYFDLEVEDTIGTLNPELACFDPANTDGKFCDTIRRDQVTYDVDQLIETLYNRGTLHTRGIDTQIDFQTDLSAALAIGGDDATLNVNLIWTHVFENTVQETPAGTELRCHGHYGYPCTNFSDGFTYPVDRVNAFANYASGNLGLHLAWRWIDGTRNGEYLIPDITGGAVRDLAITKVGSKNYIDAGASWQITGNIVGRLNISNLTDTNPPIMADAVFSNNTDSRMYDLFGRSYSLSFSLRH